LTRLNAIVAALVVTIYLGTISFGLRVRSLDFFRPSPNPATGLAWQPMSRDAIPEGAPGDSIRSGLHIFEDTALYAPRYTDSKVSCSSCHAAGGIQPYAVPLVGAPAWFPMYSKRAGHRISLADRIEECFVRSENGRPLPYDSPEMKAIVAYIEWLSTPEPHHLPFSSRGLALLPEMHADAKRGAALYAEQCAGCHGDHGQGTPPMFPPLWGPDSFNDGAGMNQVRKMASFVYSNMPQNRMGILSEQEAFDVSAFIHQQRRPPFNPAYSKY
jgi:thiosulfate dehydrogenase